MKRRLFAIISFILCISTLFSLIACTDTTVPNGGASTNVGDATQSQISTDYLTGLPTDTLSGTVTDILSGIATESLTGLPFGVLPIKKGSCIFSEAL